MPLDHGPDMRVQFFAPGPSLVLQGFGTHEGAVYPGPEEGVKKPREASENDSERRRFRGLRWRRSHRRGGPIRGLVRSAGSNLVRLRDELSVPAQSRRPPGHNEWGEARKPRFSQVHIGPVATGIPHSIEHRCRRRPRWEAGNAGPYRIPGRGIRRSRLPAGRRPVGPGPGQLAGESHGDGAADGARGTVDQVHVRVESGLGPLTELPSVAHHHGAVRQERPEAFADPERMDGTPRATTANASHSVRRP